MSLKNYTERKMNKEGVELLKEILSLHGWGGYGYENGLVERGVLYLEGENIKRYKVSIDSQKIDEVDNKIKKYLTQVK
jgi:hypothetical protein